MKEFVKSGYVIKFHIMTFAMHIMDMIQLYLRQTVVRNILNPFNNHAFLVSLEISNTTYTRVFVLTHLLFFSYVILSSKQVTLNTLQSIYFVVINCKIRCCIQCWFTFLINRWSSR